jgi:uncharacterized protein (UPF0264 family)
MNEVIHHVPRAVYTFRVVVDSGYPVHLYIGSTERVSSPHPAAAAEADLTVLSVDFVQGTRTRLHAASPRPLYCIIITARLTPSTVLGKIYRRLRHVSTLSSGSFSNDFRTAVCMDGPISSLQHHSHKVEALPAWAIT